MFLSACATHSPEMNSASQFDSQFTTGRNAVITRPAFDWQKSKYKELSFEARSKIMEDFAIQKATEYCQSQKMLFVRKTGGGITSSLMFFEQIPSGFELNFECNSSSTLTQTTHLDCSILLNKEKPECLPINCLNSLRPLQHGEILVTLGERSIARIHQNNWESTFEGKELSQVTTLFRVPGKTGTEIEPSFDYDALQNTCFTYAKPKSGSLSSQQLYSSSAKANFGLSLNEKWKALMTSRIPLSKGRRLHIYGVSDLNKNGFPEVWYRAGRPNCEELEVQELTPKPSPKLIVFPFNTECGE